MFMDVVHLATAISSFVIGLWGFLELVCGMWEGNRERIILGVCLGLWSANIAR